MYINNISLYSRCAYLKAKWRAAFARHSLHIKPGLSVLVVGEFREVFRDYLRTVFGDNIEIVSSEGLIENNDGMFDYIVGDDDLGLIGLKPDLDILFSKILQPGGGILLFGKKKGLKNSVLFASEHFENCSLEKYDVVPDWVPYSVLNAIAKLAFVVEHSPLGRSLASREVLMATRCGVRRSAPTVLEFPKLLNRISVVVPCHNEGMNINRLVDSLLHHYSDYIHEIILVDDNSKDDTADCISAYNARDERVKLIRRTPPNGVGRALRDGYEAATGDFILSMDCDFLETLPEMRDLFRTVSAGYDGAIGSRFSYESIMVNYPFGKMMCNRFFHIIMRLVTNKPVHDITNNLKLYRTEVFKNLNMVEPHFSANLETGLKPIMQGYRVVEVPVSWINRRSDMGTSSFRVLRVGFPYLLSLFRSVKAVIAIKQSVSVGRETKETKASGSVGVTEFRLKSSVSNNQES